MDKELQRKLYEWEKMLYGKEEAKRRKYLRNLGTYSKWEKIYEKLKKNPTPEGMLRIMYEEMDYMRAFGFQHIAVAAKNTLERFLEDVKIKEELNERR